MVKTLELIRYDPHPTATAYYAHIKNQMLVVRQSQNFSKLCNEYTKKEQRHLPSVVGALASVLLASVLTVIPAVAEADKKRKPLKP